MNKNFLSKLPAISVIFVVALLLFTIEAFPQDQSLKELYNNPEKFDQLSSAAQTLLRNKFGPREGEKVPSSGWFSADWQWKSGPGRNNPLTSLLNSLVNDASADATALDTQSETTIIMGSGSNIIAGFNDSGSYTGGIVKFTGYSRSTDGGDTWMDGGTLPTGIYGDGGDPVLARDNTAGITYLATLEFVDDGRNIPVFKSPDDGATWLTPVVGTPGKSGLQDKEWIVVDNFAGSGQGNVYLVERDFGPGNGVYFFRSTDYGATFSPSGGTLIAPGNQGAFVQGAFVEVGMDHSVYAFWWNSSPSRIMVRKSTDQGVTFGSPVTVTTLTSNVINGGLNLPAGFRSNSFVQAAVNHANGNIYAVYNDPSAASGGDRGNIFFRRSTDGGATWGSAVMLNDDGTSNAQYFPSICVKPDGSGLAVTWYDNRNDPYNINIERWGVTATISGSDVTFGPNFKISSQFPPVFGVDPIVASTYMGDYDMMAADNTYFHTLWGDNRDQSIAVPNRKNANVRHAKFTIDGSDGITSFTSTTIDPSGGNGNGLIDVNECNNIFVTIHNDGAKPMTGVSGTLSTTTSGVTVTQSVSSYPDIPVVGDFTNTTAFQINTSPSFMAGTMIDFTLTLNHDGGSEALDFSIQSNFSVGTPSDFSNTNPTTIPDLTTIDIPITVSGFTGITGKVTLSLYMTHTWDSDLDIRLLAPNGTTVVLSFRRGGSGDNYGSDCATPIIFDDEAVTPIYSGTPPFVGTFRPEQPLSEFFGLGNGTWTLRISDHAYGDVGTFQCATLSLFPVVSNDARGAGCQIPGSYDIYTVNTKSGSVERITFLDDAEEFNPSFNNNGNLIAHDVVSSSDPHGQSIYITNVNTSNSTLLAGADGGNDASWSPDSMYIAFDRSPVGDYSIYTVPSTGGTRTLVRANAVDAEWSNNSQRLVFRDVTDGSIRTVDLSGGSETTVVSSGANPSWSNDGKYITYTDGSNIWKIKVSQSGQPQGSPVQLTFESSGVYDQQPSWSNNNKTIVFHSNRITGDYDIWTVSANGGTPSLLTGNPDYGDYDPCYSKNGKYFAYAGFTAASLPKGNPNNQEKVSNDNSVPTEYSLNQNYPNPFNPTTVIRYSLPENAHVSLIVYDMLGRQVAELVNGEIGAGIHQAVFDGSRLSSGIYLYKLTAGNFVQLNKMLLLK